MWSSEWEVGEEWLVLVTLLEKPEHPFRKVGRGVEGTFDIFVRYLLAPFNVQRGEKLHCRCVIVQEWLVKVLYSQLKPAERAIVTRTMISCPRKQPKYLLKASRVRMSVSGQTQMPFSW